MTIAVFLPFGTILEGVPAIVMLTPILAPIARELGINMVHYGVIIAATQGISVFTPPVGISLLVACSVGRVSPSKVARPLLPYLGLLLIITLIIAFFPDLSLFTPRLMGYR
jgi:TRAP-type C4-dicarboxylate transport system permease large subunit